MRIILILLMALLVGCQHVLYFSGPLTNVCVSVVDIGNSSTLTPTTTLTVPAFAGAVGPLATDEDGKATTMYPDSVTRCYTTTKSK